MYCIIDLHSEAESSNHLSRLMEHENALSEYYALGGNMRKNNSLMGQYQFSS